MIVLLGYIKELFIHFSAKVKDIFYLNFDNFVCSFSLKAYCAFFAAAGLKTKCKELLNIIIIITRYF